MTNRCLNTVVEDICQRGCRYVNAVLADADARHDCDALGTLSAREVDRVLSELKDVMAVYDQTGSCDI